MKKILYLLLGIAITFSACKKDDDDDDKGPDPQKKQYALVLELTGTWCGACPGAATTLHNLDGIYGSDMVPIAVHGSNGDPMEISCYSSFRSDRSSSSFPSFFVPHERIGNNQSTVAADIDAQLAWSPVVAGVDFITTKTGTELKVEAKVRFFEASDETFLLSIFLLENGIDGGPDAGAYKQTSGGTGYTHEYVLRDCASGSIFWGESLNTSSVTPNQEFEKEHTFTINPEWNSDNVYVACVIWQVNTSGTPVQYLYVNAKDNR